MRKMPPKNPFSCGLWATTSEGLLWRRKGTYQSPTGCPPLLVCALDTWATRGHQSTLGHLEAHRPSYYQNTWETLCGQKHTVDKSKIIMVRIMGKSLRLNPNRIKSTHFRFNTSFKGNKTDLVFWPRQITFVTHYHSWLSPPTSVLCKRIKRQIAM